MFWYYSYYYQVSCPVLVHHRMYHSVMTLNLLHAIARRLTRPLIRPHMDLFVFVAILNPRYIGLKRVNAYRDIQ